MRSVGSQGVPRWSEPISHRTGPVPPPTILNVIVTHTITQKVKEGLQVEVVVHLEWEISGFNDTTDGLQPSQIVPVPTPTPGSSTLGYGMGDFTECDIELGSMTAIIGYVGEVKLNNFTNPDQDRVMLFKVCVFSFIHVLALYMNWWH